MLKKQKLLNNLSFTVSDVFLRFLKTDYDIKRSVYSYG